MRSSIAPAVEVEQVLESLAGFPTAFFQLRPVAKFGDIAEAQVRDWNDMLRDAQERAQIIEI